MDTISKRLRPSGILIIGPNGDSIHVPWTSLSPRTSLWRPNADQRRIHPWLPRGVTYPQHLVSRLQLHQCRREFRRGTLDQRLVVNSPVPESVLLLTLGVVLAVLLTVGTVRFTRGALGTWATYHTHLPASFLMASLIVAGGMIFMGAGLIYAYLSVPIAALRRHYHNPRVGVFRFRSSGLVVEYRDGSETFSPWTDLIDVGVTGRLAFRGSAATIELPYLQARQWRPLIRVLQTDVSDRPQPPHPWRGIIVRSTLWCVAAAAAAEWTLWYATRLNGAAYPAGLGSLCVVGLGGVLALEAWLSLNGERRLRRFFRVRQRRRAAKRGHQRQDPGSLARR